MWAIRRLQWIIPVIVARNLWGHPDHPKPSMVVDGSLDTNLMCQYCKDTGHELENCKQLQNKLTHKHAAMQSIGD